ncbi:MAG: hypothetical protein A2231_08930 [Candidatus Firestonebacteria bacterium RIFOXYA2_FULL_40_8]|nr:MAG: hypothetical protein A2231_08930 [Candidatus Firestonebacteria bacterium RIFOXYA2_FULL_40_8]
MSTTVFDMIKKEKTKIYFNTRCVLLRIPSILKVGESFSLFISVINNDGLPDQSFNLPIYFEENSLLGKLPKTIKFSSEDKGLLTIKGLVPNLTGILRISAKIRYQNEYFKVTSNPCWVEENPAHRIFWGDLHVHSILGTCQVHETKEPELAWLYARDVSHHDFLAVTDHLYGITPAKWELLKKLAKKYNKPGVFSAILAYESSHKSGLGGDNNVYFSGDTGKIFPLPKEAQGTVKSPVPLKTLWKFLDKSGDDYITIPHHTARKEKYKDFETDDYNKKREPVFEIYSMWGSSERKLNQYNFWRGRSDKKSYFQDALLNGCKYGVVASGDDHTTMPMSQLIYAKEPFGTKINRSPHAGLTAVLAEKNTVKSIFEAVRKRRCYGTTFEKTLLDFKVNSTIQGGTVTIKHNADEMKKRFLKIKISDVCLGDPKGLITIVRNNKEICVLKLNKSDGEFVYEDKEKLEKLFIKKSRFNPNPFVYYYIRYDKEGYNETTWSSPIWIELE